MNYLGHAFLSFGNGDILTGNMIGDHVKGKAAIDLFPDGIKKGLILHRKIDGYTDLHPATQRAKLIFREAYGLYAGPIVDTLIDHYLASDPKYFKTQEALLDFTQKTYSQLQENEKYFPPGFSGYFTSMRTHNWLYNYRNLKGMERSLSGLARRAEYMPPSDAAYEIFVANYYHLNQCYYELIDDVIKFARLELSN